MFYSKKFQSIFGFFISGALIIWIVRTVDWDVVFHEILKTQLWVIPLLIALTLIQTGMRAQRWRFLLPEAQNVALIDLFNGIMLGNFATFILPLRAGEFIRPYFLSRLTKYSFATAFVSVVIERFFDLSMVLVSFAVTVRFVSGIPVWAKQGAYALGFMALAILVFIVIGGRYPFVIEKVSHPFIQHLPIRFQQKAGNFINELLKGANVLRDPYALINIVLLTAGVWVITFATFQVSFWLFGMHLSLWAGIALGVITALAVAAPSAPGFIGIYQTSFIAALILFNVSKEVSTALSLIMHTLQYLIFVLYGIWLLVKFNLSVHQLNTASEEK